MFGAVINLNLNDEEAGKIVIEGMFKAFAAINPTAWKDWTSLRLYNSIKKSHPTVPALLGRTAKRNKLELSLLNDVVLRAREKFGLRWDKYDTYVNGFEKSLLAGAVKSTVIKLDDLPIFAKAPEPAWKKYLPWGLGLAALALVANQGKRVQNPIKRCKKSRMSRARGAASSMPLVSDRRSPLSRKTRKKFSKKISLLMREGYPQKQAVAIAYSMKRRGKL